MSIYLKTLQPSPNGQTGQRAYTAPLEARNNTVKNPQDTGGPNVNAMTL